MLTMTEASYRTITEETKRCQTETGGILIGTIASPMVLYAGVPGPKAGMSSARFEPDVDHDRKLLEQEIDRYEGRVKILGYWHKHPRFKPRPSQGDRNQARELADELGNNAPFYFLITTLKREEVKIRGYRLDDSQGDLKSMDHKIIKDDSDEIRKALEKEPPCILTQKSNLWQDSDFQYYQTERGKARLISEVKELKEAGFEVKVVRDKEDKRSSLRVKRDGGEFSILPPIEYPLNPPKIFQSDFEISELETLERWNSDCRLKAVLEEAIGKKSESGEPEFRVTEVTITIKPRRNHASDFIKGAVSEAKAIAGKFKRLWLHQRK